MRTPTPGGKSATLNALPRFAACFGNHARGEYLIARAALHVGRNGVGLHHARRCQHLVRFEELADAIAGAGTVRFGLADSRGVAGRS